MIKNLLEQLNKKAKANDYFIVITCNVRTSQFLREFNEKFQEDLLKYKKQKANNIVVYDAKLGEEEGEIILFYNLVMRVAFYTYDDYIAEDIKSPIMITKIEAVNFAEIHRSLSFLVNNLK